MAIYKVYAQCATAFKPITEITLDDAHSYICDATAYIIESYPHLLPDTDDDAEINAAYEKLYDRAITAFEEYGFFDCGDFQVTMSDEYPTRSGSYGYMDISFLE